MLKPLYENKIMPGSLENKDNEKKAKKPRKKPKSTILIGDNNTDKMPSDDVSEQAGSKE